LLLTLPYPLLEEFLRRAISTKKEVYYSVDFMLKAKNLKVFFQVSKKNPLILCWRLTILISAMAMIRFR
ncbi:uncharacterized protein METZ01_LOCUS165633, partial [marine metagenome]